MLLFLYNFFKGVKMKKNDQIILEITALSSLGAGIGKYNGFAVFVDQTAVGDRVKAHIIKVKKSFAVGKLLEVITPSPHRKEVDCEAFRQCGGCSFRHITYQNELEVKERSVRDAIERIGGIDLKPLPVTPSPALAHYRNKAQYPFSNTETGLCYGFYARHSHRVVKNFGCLLQPEVFERAMRGIKIWADKFGLVAYNEQTGKGLLRHALLRLGETSGEVMVVLVINDDTLPFADELTKTLKEHIGDALYSLEYNINKKDTNVILGDKTVLIYGKPYINDEICGVKVQISAESFYQVNRSAAEVLYKKAAAYIEKGDSVIIDLFCGIGTIGLSVLNLCGAENRRLFGVEIVPEAIENAKQNAQRLGTENCEFILGDATKAANGLKMRGVKPDVVIVDPPRKGCDASLLEIIANDFAPKKIIYISCDPATLARDAKLLKELGYNLKEYSPVDLFPATAHVETVALLVRIN